VKVEHKLCHFIKTPHLEAVLASERDRREVSATFHVTRFRDRRDLQEDRGWSVDNLGRTLWRFT
jgi:hypothetical protein